MTTAPRVLVVDDDAVMRAVLERVFVNAGFQVQLFASAQALLSGADLGQPAVLLLDMKMPGMTGLELHAVLRSRGVSLPVMFLTGSADVPVAVAAMRAGAVDFLEKPFASAELVRRVARAFAPAAEGAGLPQPPVSDHAQRLASLTPREREVHELMIDGLTSKQIAIELGGSFRTVEVHRARVMSKMGVANLAELVRASYGVADGADPADDADGRGAGPAVPEGGADAPGST